MSDMSEVQTCVRKVLSTRALAARRAACAHTACITCGWRSLDFCTTLAAWLRQMLLAPQDSEAHTTVCLGARPLCVLGRTGRGGCGVGLGCNWPWPGEICARRAVCLQHWATMAASACGGCGWLGGLHVYVRVAAEGCHEGRVQFALRHICYVHDSVCAAGFPLAAWQRVMVWPGVR